MDFSSFYSRHILAATEPSLLSVLIWIAGALIIGTGLAAIYWIAKRQVADKERIYPLEKPVVAPTRWHYLFALVFYTAFVAYGSLVPLNFDHELNFTEAVERFREVPFLPESVHSRSDWVVNLLMFIFVSFFAMGFLLVDRPSRALKAILTPMVVLASIAGGLLLEFVQIWFPPRTVSQNDILAEATGAIVGVVLWLWMGQTLTGWLRSYFLTLRSKNQFDWLLQAYFAGLVIYTLMPLDLTVRPAELVKKYREGRIVLLPFSEVEPVLWSIFARTTDVLVYIPVGILASSIFTKRPRQLRARTDSLLIAAAIVCLFEAAHIFVFTRYASTTDLITGGLGAFLGVELIHRWGYGKAQPAAIRSASGTAQFWGLLMLIGLYSGFLVVMFCAPFDLVHDVAQAKERFQEFWEWPFTAMYYGTEFNAMTQMVRKMLLFAPLGTLFVLALGPYRLSSTIRFGSFGCFVCYAIAVALSIEMLQLFSPRSGPTAHTPELTDVILCGAGALAGVLLTDRLIAFSSQATG